MAEPRKPRTSVGENDRPSHTPGQAEGTEEDIDSALKSQTGSAPKTVSRDPKVGRSSAPQPGKTPGQAEG